jgi:cytochrome c553
MNTPLMAVVLAAAAFTIGGTAQAEGSASNGQKKTQMCEGCHGIAGFRTAYPEVYMVPKLGGQSANYIVAALKAYKSGDRSHPSMRAIAGSLTDQDMADLAAYYATAEKAAK